MLIKLDEYMMYRKYRLDIINGPRQANLVLIAYASSEGSGEPAQSRQNLRCLLIQAVSQEEPSEWLGMRSYNLS